MPNLDYAELTTAADALASHLYARPQACWSERKDILAAFIDIVTRALEQAAIPEGRYERGEYGASESELYPRLSLGDPPVPLADAIAALGAPVSETPKPSTVPLTDAEVLSKLPAFLRNKDGGLITEDDLKALIEKIRWA